MLIAQVSLKKGILLALGALAFISSAGCGMGSLLGLGGSTDGGTGSSLAAPTTLAYTIHYVTYVRNATIPDNIPTTDAQEITSYSIDTPLPTGMDFDTTTGIISGKPTVLSPQTSYTVTVTNASGSTVRSLLIEVADGWVVDSTADTADFNTGDGFCDTDDSVGDGPCTLRAAIEQANVTGGDRAIDVPAGTITIDTTTISIGSAGLTDLVITGQGASSTILSGGTTSPRMFITTDATNVRFNEVTLSDGAEGSDGAALRHDSSGTLSFYKSTITNNHTTTNAAAVAVLGGSGTFVETTFSGNSTGTSGGALGATVSLILSHSTFSGNTAGLEGGAIWSNSSIGIGECTFTGNTASDSGGAILARGGSLTVSASTFSGNNATITAGGAVRADSNALVTMLDTTFSGNTASDGASVSGGAIYLIGLGANTATFDRMTFTGNTGDFGGAIAVEDSTVNITNSTFSGNSSPVAGGALYLGDSGPGATMNIRQSTIADNTCTATAQGGGIFATGAGATVNFTQSIIARNIADSILYNCMSTGGASLVAGSYNLSDTDATDCNVDAGALTPDIENADVSALASSLADNGGIVRTLSVGATFAGVNAIPSGDCFSASDARSVARPQGGACDIGAFELE